MRSIAILAVCAAVGIGTLPMMVYSQADAQTTQSDTKSMWEKIKGSWNQTKGAVKEQWGKLTDDDLLEIEGPSRSARRQDPDPLRHHARTGRSPGQHLGAEARSRHVSEIDGRRSCKSHFVS